MGAWEGRRWDGMEREGKGHPPPPLSLFFTLSLFCSPGARGAAPRRRARRPGPRPGGGCGRPRRGRGWGVGRDEGGTGGEVERGRAGETPLSRAAARARSLPAPLSLAFHPHLLWLIPVVAGQQDVALQVQEVERGDGGHGDRGGEGRATGRGRDPMGRPLAARGRVEKARAPRGDAGAGARGRGGRGHEPVCLEAWALRLRVRRASPGAGGWRRARKKKLNSATRGEREREKNARSPSARPPHPPTPHSPFFLSVLQTTPCRRLRPCACWAACSGGSARPWIRWGRGCRGGSHPRRQVRAEGAARKKKNALFSVFLAG